MPIFRGFWELFVSTEERGTYLIFWKWIWSQINLVDNDSNYVVINFARLISHENYWVFGFIGSKWYSVPLFEPTRSQSSSRTQREQPCAKARPWATFNHESSSPALNTNNHTTSIPITLSQEHQNTFKDEQISRIKNHYSNYWILKSAISMAHAQKPAKGAGGGKAAPKKKGPSAKKPEDDREETLQAVVCADIRGYWRSMRGKVIGRLTQMYRCLRIRSRRDSIPSH